MKNKSFHVVGYSDGKWGVRKTGTSRASKNFDRQSDAVSYARSTAKSHGGEIIVHGRDGRIRERDCYHHDTSPPRGGKDSPHRSLNPPRGKR